jgi:hypothetical protein
LGTRAGDTSADSWAALARKAFQAASAGVRKGMPITCQLSFGADPDINVAAAALERFFKRDEECAAAAASLAAGLELSKIFTVKVK